MKCTKLLSKPSTGFGGWVKCTKLVMDEMYEINGKNSKGSTDYCVLPLHPCCRFIAKFEYEYCRICVVAVVRARDDVLVLVVRAGLCV